VLAGGVALAVLAAEYPEKFEQIRESLPEYFDRGMHVMEMAAKAGRKIGESSGRSLVDAWEEL
jgi:K+/H+ antiporter YhaU regulatory subunit KhtT